MMAHLATTYGDGRVCAIDANRPPLFRSMSTPRKSGLVREAADIRREVVAR